MGNKQALLAAAGAPSCDAVVVQPIKYVAACDWKPTDDCLPEPPAKKQCFDGPNPKWEGQWERLTDCGQVDTELGIITISIETDSCTGDSKLNFKAAEYNGNSDSVNGTFAYNCKCFKGCTNIVTADANLNLDGCNTKDDTIKFIIKAGKTTSSKWRRVKCLPSLTCEEEKKAKMRAFLANLKARKIAEEAKKAAECARKEEEADKIRVKNEEKAKAAQQAKACEENQKAADRLKQEECAAKMRESARRKEEAAAKAAEEKCKQERAKAEEAAKVTEAKIEEEACKLMAEFENVRATGAGTCKINGEYIIQDTCGENNSKVYKYFGFTLKVVTGVWGIYDPCGNRYYQAASDGSAKPPTSGWKSDGCDKGAAPGPTIAFFSACL